MKNAKILNLSYEISESEFLKKIEMVFPIQRQGCDFLVVVIFKSI